jgi:hypothetical protein
VLAPLTASDSATLSLLDLLATLRHLKDNRRRLDLRLDQTPPHRVAGQAPMTGMLDNK